MTRIRTGALAGFAALAAAAQAAAPAATPVRVLWSTYLRTGPTDDSEAAAELEHDTRVELHGCRDRWCRVTTGGAAGYVAQDALDLPRPPPLVRHAGPGCAAVAQADDHGRVATRVCPARPGG